MTGVSHNFSQACSSSYGDCHLKIPMIGLFHCLGETRVKLGRPAHKINSRHDSNSLSVKNLYQCPVWCVPSPLSFALAFSDFLIISIQESRYTHFLYLKKMSGPETDTKEGSSYVYSHVRSVTYLFMINSHF